MIGLGTHGFSPALQAVSGPLPLRSKALGGDIGLKYEVGTDESLTLFADGSKSLYFVSYRVYKAMVLSVFFFPKPTYGDNEVFFAYAL